MLWEQAAACNYFPTDKRLMGVYCLYWIFRASLSKLQASHPWLTLSSPRASQAFHGLGSQLVQCDRQERPRVRGFHHQAPALGV